VKKDNHGSVPGVGWELQKEPTFHSGYEQRELLKSIWGGQAGVTFPFSVFLEERPHSGKKSRTVGGGPLRPGLKTRGGKQHEAKKPSKKRMKKLGGQETTPFGRES
jgi:hypothetical protein